MALNLVRTVARQNIRMFHHETWVSGTHGVWTLTDIQTDWDAEKTLRQTDVYLGHAN